MDRIVQWLFGIEADKPLPDDGRLMFDYPTDELWVLGGLFAALLGVAYVVGVYLREGRNIGQWKAMLLTGLRLAAVVVAIFVLARPRWEWEIPQPPENPDELEPEPPAVVILVDESRTMSVVDADKELPEPLAAKLAETLGLKDSAGLRNKSRLRLVQDAFGNEARTLAERLRKGLNVTAPAGSTAPVNRLRVYAFAVEPRELYAEEYRRRIKPGSPADNKSTKSDAKSTKSDAKSDSATPGTTAGTPGEEDAGPSPSEMLDRNTEALRLRAVGAFRDAEGRLISLDEVRETKDKDLAALRDAFDARRGETNLGGSLATLLRDRSLKLAAIVVASDGRNNGLPLAGAEQLARQARIPVHTLGVGNPVADVNLQVVALIASDTPRKNETFKLRTVLGHVGLADKAVTFDVVRRRIERDDKGVRLPAKDTDWQPVAPGPDAVTLDAEQVRDVEFATRSAEIGEFEYKIKAKVDGVAERNPRDNEQTVEIRILDDRPKVLLVCGAGGWEYRALKNMLVRSQGIRASIFLQSASSDFGQESSLRDPNDRELQDMAILDLPRSRERLAKYDLIILMDPAFTSTRIELETSRDRRIDPKWTETVKKLVTNEGLGLLYIAGVKNTAPLFDQRDPEKPTQGLFRDLQDLLPVIPEKFALRLTRGARVGYPMSVTEDEGRRHPMFVFRDLGTPEESLRENVAFWERLPRVFWAMPVQKVKDSAVVLAEHASPENRIGDQPVPLIAEQRSGMGRCLYFGFDSTWRWRFLGDDVFNDFWRRTIKHAIEGRRLGGRKRLQLLTDGKDLYNTGEPVTLIARLLDSKFEPLRLKDGQVVLSVARQVPGSRDGDPKETVDVVMSFVPGTEGEYRGKYTTTKPGQFEVSLKRDLGMGNSEMGTSGMGTTGMGTTGMGTTGMGSLGDPADLPTDDVKTTFRVASLDREMRDTRADFEELKRLSRETGGTFLPIGQIGKLAEAIKDKPIQKPRVAVQAKEPIKESKTLWDAPLWMILFAMFLMLEWGIRKFSDMA